MTGIAILLAATAVAVAFGLWRAATDGRLRRSDEHNTSLTSSDLGRQLGEHATLVQFSSSFCAPCRATRVLLEDIASGDDAVAYVDIDVETHIDLVRRLDVTRTPTVLVLDGDGAVRHRAIGLPRRADVLAILEPVAA